MTLIISKLKGCRNIPNADQTPLPSERPLHVEDKKKKKKQRNKSC